MNNTPTTSELDIFQQSFDTLPEEAREFILGDTYSSIIKEIQSFIPLTEEQVRLEKSILLFLVGEQNMDGFVDTIESLSVEENSKSKILILIKEKIVDELLLTIEVVSELENGLPVPPTPKEGGQDAPSPAQVLESLKMRLTQKSSITPVARQQTTPKQAQQPEQEKPAVDLYREIPS